MHDRLERRAAAAERARLSSTWLVCCSAALPAATRPESAREAGSADDEAEKIAIGSPSEPAPVEGEAEEQAVGELSARSAEPEAALAASEKAADSEELA